MPGRGRPLLILRAPYPLGNRGGRRPRRGAAGRELVEQRRLEHAAVREVQGDRQGRAGSDAAELAWVPLPDVAERNLSDGLAEFLHEHGITGSPSLTP